MRETFRNLIFIGLATWVIVAVPTMYWQVKAAGAASASTWGMAAALVAFLVFYLVRNRTDCSRPMQALMLGAQAAAGLGAVALQPKGFATVLLVVVAGQLGGYPLGIAAAACLAEALGLGMVIGWQNGAMVFAYAAFFLFAAFTAHIAHSEAEARQALAEANAELTLTSGLLDINSRTSERLRIARELHDLLGHHLTALSLNLETASHLADGEARQQVEKSKAIAKKLLSDVRSVVSRLRDEEPVDLSDALHSLHDVISTPALHLEMPEGLSVTDAQVAQVALRTVQEIVTNAVRHSGARNLWLTLGTSDHTLSIDARDDGGGTDHVRFGNGLRGIRERVEQVRGSLEVSSARGRGFSVRVRLPLAGAAA